MPIAYDVRQVSRAECKPFIEAIHYAKRWPSISHAFGLFRDGVLCGVVTYGSPFSSTLRNGIAGAEYGKYVIELNRLCLLTNERNEASLLVGRSLRMLPKPSIVVSFADTSQGHKGTVYQAANFYYYGLSAKRSDWKIKGLEHLHSQTISDMFRGVEGTRADAIRAEYGDRFYYADRPRKHRYIYFVGSKQFKRTVRDAVKYKQEEYPQ